MIRTHGLRATLGDFPLGPIDLDVPRGALGLLVGPSGAGKTSALRALAGIIPSTGAIEIAGGRVEALPPERRPLGWVPQGGGLFPHLTAAGNVELVRAASAPPALELLARVGAAPLAARRPQALSGGERLRVALARALARQAPVLLLDEPFAAIDRSGTSSLAALVRELCAGGVTALVVSHDIERARDADWLGILCRGRLLAGGPPRELLASEAGGELGELLRG